MPKPKQGWDSPSEDTGYDTGRSSPEDILPSLLKLKSGGSGVSFTLLANLGPYIESYKAGDDAAHAFYREDLENALSGVVGAGLWIIVLNASLNAAVEGGRITPEERVVIQKSPACELMISSFVEVVKNLLDEAILGHYESGKSPQLEMKVDIDASSPDRIKLIIADNGRGFPPDFLTKNSTTAGKEAYIMDAGSTKKTTPDKATMAVDEPSRETTPPKLFGGAGLGLRVLIAGVLHGDMLAGPGCLQSRYERPAISEISLSNREDSPGTLVQITTSRTPLKERVEVSMEASASATSRASAAPAGASAAPSIKLGMPPKKKKAVPSAGDPASSETVSSVAVVDKNPGISAIEMKKKMAELQPTETQDLADKGVVTRPK